MAGVSLATDQQKERDIMINSTTGKRVAAVLLVICALALVLLVVFGEQYKNALAYNTVENPNPAVETVYYAHGDLDPNDDIPAKDGKNYFGYNRYRAATESGVDPLVDWFITKDGLGDLIESIRKDPALLAAHALNIDLNMQDVEGYEPILAEEQNLPVGARADEAHLRFLAKPEDREAALQRVISFYCGEGNEYSVEDISAYTSAMYMISNALEGDKPAVIVQNTNNEGGHMLVIKVLLKDNNWIVLRFRLECGYQPIDVPHWPPPGDTPTPTPTTTPTPEPKNRDDDPQNRPGASDYDFYAPDPVNHDPDTTGTPEPTSPDDDYVAPAPPTEEPTPTPTTAPEPTTSPSEPSEPGYVVEPPDDSGYDPLDPIADPSNPDKPTPVVEDPDVDAPVDDYE